MFFAVLASTVMFTYWAYYRIVIKKEKNAWREIEWVAVIVLVFLLTLYVILAY